MFPFLSDAHRAIPAAAQSGAGVVSRIRGAPGISCAGATALWASGPSGLA